jgi:hypothetical protein
MPRKRAALAAIIAARSKRPGSRRGRIFDLDRRPDARNALEFCSAVLASFFCMIVAFSTLPTRWRTSVSHLGTSTEAPLKTSCLLGYSP